MKKNKTLINITLIILAIIYVVMVVIMVSRNIPYGTGAVISVIVMNILSLFFLVGSISKKKLWLKIVCSILFIAWIVFGFYASSSSANEDAMIVMAIYAIAGGLIILFGNLRNYWRCI